MTLHDLLRDYVAHLRARDYSPGTIEEVWYCTGKMLRWLASVKKVTSPEKLREEHLASWQRHLSQARTDRGFPLKPGTVNKTVTYVKGFLKHMAQKGHLVRSLAEVPQRVKESQTLPTSVLSHKQVKDLLNQVDTSTPEGQRNRTIMELLYSTGIRARELLGLNVQDVDFDRGTALVHGKGSKDRVVPVGKTALRFLRSYVAGVRPFLLHAPSEQALFLNPLGRRLSYDSLRNWIRRHADSVGLDVHVTAHTFRSYAELGITGGRARRKCSGAAPGCITSRSCSAMNPWTR